MSSVTFCFDGLLNLCGIWITTYFLTAFTWCDLQHVMPSSYNRYVTKQLITSKNYSWCYGENREPGLLSKYQPDSFCRQPKNNTDKRESEADMFLNYFALGVLIFVFLVIFYGIIAIHDIPYLIESATIPMPTLFIRRAGWACLLCMLSGRFCDSGATLYQPERGWGWRSHMLRRRRKRLTRKSPHFLTEFPGWASTRRREKRLTIPRSRRSNYDLLIVLTYVALAWAVFKIFRIPVNQWTLATAALGGVFLVSGLILLMNYNHPYTFTAQKAVIAIPITPQVTGIVTAGHWQE